jgi:hypothetical protein
MQKLKITAFLADGKTLYKSRYPSADDVPDREWFPGYWRFYGSIRELGIDQGFATNCEALGVAADKLDYESIENGEVTSIHSQYKRREMNFDGIVDVEVEGVQKPCKGYFWTESRTVRYGGKVFPMWDQHGLIVYADNEKDNAEASARRKEARRVIPYELNRVAW